MIAIFRQIFEPCLELICEVPPGLPYAYGARSESELKRCAEHDHHAGGAVNEGQGSKTKKTPRARHRFRSCRSKRQCDGRYSADAWSKNVI